MLTQRLLLLATLVLTLGSVSAPARATGITNPTPQRSYVSALSGNDSNNCGQTAPCRTINTALNQVIDGGEVLVLDSGGYGALVNGALITITKGVTITVPPGIYAGVSPAANVIGVQINAPNKVVVLRGLTINTQSPPQSVQYATGISILAAGSVKIEHCNIGGAVPGLTAQQGPLNLEISDSVFTNNADAISLGGGTATTPAVSILATVNNTSIVGAYVSGNNPGNTYVGIDVGTGAELTLTNSRVSGYEIDVLLESGPPAPEFIATNNVFNSSDCNVLLEGSATALLSNNVLTGTSLVTDSGANSFGAAVYFNGDGGVVTLSGNQIFGNDVGVTLNSNVTGYTLNSYQNNDFYHNGTNLLNVVSAHPPAL